MLWTVLLILSMTLARMSLSVAEKRASESSRGAKVAGEVLEVAIVAVCAVFLVVRPFVAQAFYIPSASMHPTLVEEDRILVNKLSYRFEGPSRQDVVVFRAPKEALSREQSGAQEETDFVKRVVGLPGDLIEVNHGCVFVNGKARPEPYCQEPPYYDLPPYVVPPGKLFVMGDNRNHSNDSHEWGPLPMDRVIGRAMCIFWHPGRVGRIR